MKTTVKIMISTTIGRGLNKFDKRPFVGIYDRSWIKLVQSTTVRVHSRRVVSELPWTEGQPATAVVITARRMWFFTEHARLENCNKTVSSISLSSISRL